MAVLGALEFEIPIHFSVLTEKELCFTEDTNMVFLLKSHTELAPVLTSILNRNITIIKPTAWEHS
jgi:hypothetical protein